MLLPLLLLYGRMFDSYRNGIYLHAITRLKGKTNNNREVVIFFKSVRFWKEVFFIETGLFKQ